MSERIVLGQRPRVCDDNRRRRTRNPVRIRSGPATVKSNVMCSSQDVVLASHRPGPRTAPQAASVVTRQEAPDVAVPLHRHCRRR